MTPLGAMKTCLRCAIGWSGMPLHFRHPEPSRRATLHGSNMTTLSFRDFETSARTVLSFLRRRLGFDLWMITRTEGKDWIVLQTEGHKPGVTPGAVFRWADSFCFEMVKGNGPRMAPQTDLIPAYAASPLGRQFQVKAYVGAPLVRSDGSLFGTLCAIHPSPQPASIVDEQELVALLSAMLSRVLQLELDAAEAARRAERLEMEALVDSLTNTYNRRGWDRLLTSEEERCRRYGHSAAVLVIDLDGLKRVNDTLGHASGDALIMRAAAALRKAARANDIVARLGGDEFGVIAVECDRDGAESLLLRVRAALAEENVSASVGLAVRIPSAGIKDAWKKADQRMYEDKRSR